MALQHNHDIDAAATSERAGQGGMDTGTSDEMHSAERQPPSRLSEVFAELSRQADGPVSVAALRDAFGDRSLAALLVLFSAFNMIPLPPGATAVTGLPLLIIAAQMIYGGNRAWLPKLLTRRSIPLNTFRAIIDWTVPRLQRIERLIRPRYWPFYDGHSDRIIGLITLVMAIYIILPIPLSNWPPAFASALLGLSLIERDGILFAAGTVAAIASTVLVAFVIGAAVVALEAVWNWLF
jgi:hypothetical protein